MRNSFGCCAHERENHWLASKVARQRGEKKQMVPVWEAFSYLIVGCERWNADENFRAQVRGIHAKYGTVFHIFVDTFDQ